MVIILKFTTLCYIEKNDKYLMLYRNKKENDLNEGKWIGVGGKFEEKESPEECLIREVKEETGLSIRIQDGFKQQVEYSPKPNIHKKVVYFLGEWGGDQVVKQEEEVSEIKWINLEDAEQVLTYDNDKNLVRSAKRFLIQP